MLVERIMLAGLMAFLWVLLLVLLLGSYLERLWGFDLGIGLAILTVILSEKSSVDWMVLVLET